MTDIGGADRLAISRATDVSTRGLEEVRRLSQAGREDEAARKFEAVLAVQLVKEMRRSLPEGFFGKGTGNDVYQAWFDEHVARSIADSGALELGDDLRDALRDASADDTENDEVIG